MKDKLIIATVFLLIFSAQCKKDSGTPTGPDSNSHPVLVTIGNQTLKAGATLNVAISATDANGDSLTFSITSNPGFLSISGFSQSGNTANATLVISPGSNQEGTFNVGVTVTDGKGGEDSEAFSIEVTGPAFLLSDLAGTWIGTSKNSSVTVNWTEWKVDAQGNMECKGSGCSGSADLSIDEDTGRVTGYGVTSIISGGKLTVAQGYWRLDFSANKRGLSGIHSLAVVGWPSMDTNLTKQ